MEADEETNEERDEETGEETEFLRVAHEHPLIFNESKEIPFCCSACGLPVLLSPSYICPSRGCNFYLHEACTHLPQELFHYYCNIPEDNYFDKHTLILSAKPRDDNDKCNKCGKLCKNFTYQCSECSFVLHPLCGFPLDIKIKHALHTHQMAAMCEVAKLFCHICGIKHEGYFFSCHQCNFRTHQDCALLPSFVKIRNHAHYLSLFYLSNDLFDRHIFRDKRLLCLICGEVVIKRFMDMATKMCGFFYCFICESMAHVDCATSLKEDLGAVLNLPNSLDDSFPSLIIRAGVKERAIREGNTKTILEKYHNYSLVLIDDTTQESICNACIQPISPPYYRCSAHSECDFLLHEFCAALPHSIKHLHDEKMETFLFSPRWDDFFTLFFCVHCYKACNGFGYSTSNEYSSELVDLECGLAPAVIKHDSHEHQIVFNPYVFLTPSCCGEKTNFTMYYNCSVCEFSIHFGCAFLPQSVTHKFDIHPLYLTFTYSSQLHSDSSDHFCEFCEENIDPKIWFYHCNQCDQSFHVNCIPSVGEFSKIKFGGTVKVPCHNEHPLTLVRTLSVGSQTCGECHQIIRGFEDGLALHCADCDFWIHYRCGLQDCGLDADLNLSGRPYRSYGLQPIGYDKVF